MSSFKFEKALVESKNENMNIFKCHSIGGGCVCVCVCLSVSEQSDFFFVFVFVSNVIMVALGLRSVH